MKNKKNFLLTIFILIIIFLIGFLLYLTVMNNRIFEFDLNDYRHQIDMFPSDKILGPLETPEEVKEKAVEVWNEIYGEKTIKDEKPFRVGFDENTETWMVIGSVKPFHLGGAAKIIIRKSDGKVLAVWHEK